MAKITKKAKKVNLIIKKVTGEIVSYTCPSCRTTYTGAHGASMLSVIRFKCDCGQVLEVHAKINEVLK